MPCNWRWPFDGLCSRAPPFESLSSNVYKAYNWICVFLFYKNPLKQKDINLRACFRFKQSVNFSFIYCFEVKPLEWDPIILIYKFDLCWIRGTNGQK
jgi:hypothetical protein